MFSLINITLVVTTLLLTVISFYRGRGVLFSAIVSFYPAIALYASFPYTQKFIFFKENTEQIFYSHVLIFAVFFIIVFLVSRQIIHAEGHRIGFRKVLDSLLLSVSVVLLTTALCFHILPSRDIFNLSRDIQNFLTSDLGYFISMLAPTLVVYSMTRRSWY